MSVRFPISIRKVQERPTRFSKHCYIEVRLSSKHKRGCECFSSDACIEAKTKWELRRLILVAGLQKCRVNRDVGKMDK